MDVLCQAKSGMGKTAVFVLATLQQIEPVNGQVGGRLPRQAKLPEAAGAWLLCIQTPMPSLLCGPLKLSTVLSCNRTPQK